LANPFDRQATRSTRLQRERYEADFRFALARLREYSEQVALLRGENAERRILGGRFGSIVSNFYAIVGRTVKLLTFTTTIFRPTW
jgi:ABC-type uncharacterized transport system, permease and ATPase components